MSGALEPGTQKRLPTISSEVILREIGIRKASFCRTHILIYYFIRQSVTLHSSLIAQEEKTVIRKPLSELGTKIIRRDNCGDDTYSTHVHIGGSNQAVPVYHILPRPHFRRKTI